MQHGDTHHDTIVAQATPVGRGGVGIVRLSGPQARSIGEAVTRKSSQPRYALYTEFHDANSAPLDQGIALYFQAPHSFTGEDVFELQGHGGPVVMDLLLKRCVELGARLARPGEFSERAFLNDKLDLAQAEAIADLIDASSSAAARCALRSLQGEFSRRVHALVEALILLRIYVEAAIDFPEEEIDFLSDGKVSADLATIEQQLQALLNDAQQGALLREGMRVVIAGKPNAGKSSLLNALAGKDSAIVTDIPGTTRDVLREEIQIDGMPLHIIDTAGLRASDDSVEKIGIERAWREIEQADRILLVVDAAEMAEQDPQQLSPARLWPPLFGDKAHRAQLPPVTVVLNKIDVTGQVSEKSGRDPVVIQLSAQSGEGMELLRQHLQACVGFDTQLEGAFIARRRHLDALQRAQQHLLMGRQQLENQRAGELLADELRQSQLLLAEITGEFHSDDLLGRIFSSFCIGK